jgi:general stress protein 26
MHTLNKDVIKRAEEILANRALREQGYCVLALIDTDGYPTAATISPSKIDGIKRITFCTGIGSNWTKRIEKCNRASVCFNSGSEQYNITLVGTIDVLTDSETKNEMWYEGMGHYFKGSDDPNYCVLQFTTQRYSLMLNEQEENGSARGTL